MLCNPGMIRRHMVRHEIENQAHSAFGKFTASDRKALWPAKPIVDRVSADAVGRAHIVGGTEVSECTPEAADQTLVLISNRYSRRTPLPDTHQPNSVKAEIGDSVPLRCRDGTEV